LDEGAEDKPCIVTFEPTEKGINVTDNDGACSSYCGARAGFTGLYFKRYVKQLFQVSALGLRRTHKTRHFVDANSGRKT
jgi:hypothetical protein